jgi:hypothetical protein
VWVHFKFNSFPAEPIHVSGFNGEEFCVQKSKFVLLTLLIPALGSPLSNSVQVFGDRIAEWMSGGQLSN